MMQENLHYRPRIGVSKLTYMTKSERISQALLAKYRKKDGTINYSAASRDTGISRQNLMNWSKGYVNDIQDEFLMTLAEKTGHEPRWLSVGTGQRYSAIVDATTIAGEGVEELTTAYIPEDDTNITKIRALPPRIQEILGTLADEISVTLKARH